jgi:hypothetical protein
MSVTAVILMGHMIPPKIAKENVMDPVVVRGPTACILLQIILVALLISLSEISRNALDV